MDGWLITPEEYREFTTLRECKDGFKEIFEFVNSNL